CAVIVDTPPTEFFRVQAMIAWWYFNAQVRVVHSFFIAKSDPYAIARPCADVIIPLQVTQGLHVGYATQLREAYKMPATLSLKSETGTDRFYIIPSRSQLPSGECEDRPMVVSGNSNKPSLKNHRVPQAITAD